MVSSERAAILPMTYQGIARKYRPQTFDEIIGQAPIVQTLQNAVAQNLVAPAYIFSGMRGVGKTTTARILAKALNCVKGPTVKPCLACPPCREIAASTAVDVLELDAASNRGIDEIRELRQSARYLPARDRYKLFIIDEAHMLTTEAFNALLKTLEEPPPRVLFLLATTEPHRIPSTIHSRCQSFHFRSIGFQETLGVLERVARDEKARVEPEALAVMVRAAEGSLRDALSILDQAIAYSGERVTAAQVRELLGAVGDEVLEEFLEAIRAGSSDRMLALVDRLVRDGHNLQHFCREALRHVRNLLVVRIGGPAAELAEAAGLERDRLAAAAAHFSEEDLLRFFNVLLRAEGELRWSPHPRLHLELGLLKLVQAERLVPLEQLLAEIRGEAANPPKLEESRRLMPPVAAAPAAPSVRRGPAPSTPAGHELDPGALERIKSAVYAQSKFLGSFVDHVALWERDQGNLVLWFAPENRSMSEMLDKKKLAELEKIVTGVLGEAVKVAPKVGQASIRAEGRAPATAAGGREAVVQAFLDRFGGRVRRASELKAPDREDS
jgi:DNA polymerase-3 subunit gamma/tau